MKQLFLTVLLVIPLLVFAQDPEDFIIEIEPFQIANAPGVHSYSWGKTSDHKWVILGGRIDGLHQRQPFASFLEQDNNKNVFVIDPTGEQVWSSDLSVLSTGMFEQLQSTNQQFYQSGNTLYVIGGYGYSATVDDHITYPNLTAVSLDELANAVIYADSIAPYFRQITDTTLKVTGGQLGFMNDYYYMVGGQLFDGRYNPMGPDHGPGFIQVYTDEIRKFKIVDDGTNISIQDYSTVVDSIYLHKRDYNMAPQIFPDGTEGFTAFSGVFNPDDLPWLNCINIDSNGFNVIPSFNQYLSQYHSSKLPIYDANANTMHTIFFGGMSQYSLDEYNTLLEDANVPFVKTVSRITRYNDWTTEEVELSYLEMPTLVGSGAEFIPVEEYYLPQEILDLNAVPQSKTLVGYIYGGIESSGENIFFTNDGTQSWASNVAFKVYINKSIVSNEEIKIGGKEVFDPTIYPVPARNKLNVEFNLLRLEKLTIQIVDTNGQIVHSQQWEGVDSGWQKIKIPIDNIASGEYHLIISNGDYSATRSFTKR